MARPEKNQSGDDFIEKLVAVNRTAKVVKGGRILGASIVGANAGEVVQPWCLAIANGMKVGAMAGLVAPYPTLGEINKRVAGSYYTPKLFNERTRKIVRFLLRLG